MRIIVADGESLRRDGVVFRIKSQFPEATVVTELAHGRALLESAKERRVDLIITEVALPGIRMSAVVHQLITERLAKVVCLVGRDETKLAPIMTQAGACCLFRDDAQEASMKAIRHYMDDSWPQANPQLKPKGKDVAPLKTLTPRQAEIYQLLSRGLRSKEIAERLNLQVRTVEWYRLVINKVMSGSPRTRKKFDPVTF